MFIRTVSAGRLGPQLKWPKQRVALLYIGSANDVPPGVRRGRALVTGRL